VCRKAVGQSVCVPFFLTITFQQNDFDLDIWRDGLSCGFDDIHSYSVFDFFLIFSFLGRALD